jgi:hypothetical protein
MSYMESVAGQLDTHEDQVNETVWIHIFDAAEPINPAVRTQILELVGRNQHGLRTAVVEQAFAAVREINHDAQD